MKRSFSARVLAGLAILPLTLAGCSATTSDGDKAGDATATATEAPLDDTATDEADVDGDEDPDTDTDTGEADTPDTDDTDTFVGTPTACPGGTLEIADSGNVLDLTEDCETVTVSGSANVVNAKKIGKLILSGSANVVTAEQITTIEASESSATNTATWKAGEPETVNDSGMANVFGVDE